MEHDYTSWSLEDCSVFTPEEAVPVLLKEIERLRGEVDELKDLIQATVDYTGASVSSNRFTFHASKRFVSAKEGEQ